MLVLRILLVLGLISVAVSFAVYIFTKDARYLKFSWQLIKFNIVLLFVAAVVYAMGRIILF
jgi:hypothetical protein